VQEHPHQPHGAQGKSREANGFVEEEGEACGDQHSAVKIAPRGAGGELRGGWRPFHQEIGEEQADDAEGDHGEGGEVAA